MGLNTLASTNSIVVEDAFTVAALSYIEEMKVADEHVNSNTKIECSIFLFDANHEIVGKCFFLEPKGYIVIGNNSVVAEAAFTDTKSAQELKANSGKKIYYADSLSYLTKSSTTITYTDILSEQQIGITDAAMMQATSITANSAVDVANATAFSFEPSALPVTYYTDGTPRARRDYNPAYHCGPLAAAIMLAYYTDYVNSSVVPSWYMTTNGRELTELLTPWIIAEGKEGSNAEEVTADLNTYFRWRGISDRYTAIFGWGNDKNSTIVDHLINGRMPVIVSLNNAPIYGNHFVVAYGARLYNDI